MAELDIFTDTTADDTVTYDYGAGTITNPLQSIGVEDFQNAYTDSDISLGEDGLYYNADGERVYRFNPARELGDVGKGSGTWDEDPTTGMTYRYGAVSGDEGIQTWVTESELREMWDAKQGMGYTKQQFDSFDQYMAYVNEVDVLVNSPEYREAEQRAQQIAYLGAANGLRPDEVQAQIDAELGDVLGGFQQQWQGIRNNYGVADVYQNEDGDLFKWNGYAYVKTYKTPQAGFSDYLKMAAVVGAGYLLGGPLANALGGGTLGAAGASGIINAAQQLVLTGEINWKDALMQAAQAGLTTEAWNQLKQSGKLDELAEWIGEKANTETVTIKDAAGNVLTAEQIADLGGEAFLDLVFAGQADGYTGVITGWDVDVPDWIWDAAQGVTDIIDAGQGTDGGKGGETGDAVLAPEFQRPEGQVEEKVTEQEEEVTDKTVDEVVNSGAVDTVKEDTKETVVETGAVDVTDEDKEEVVDPGYTGGSTGPDPVGQSEQQEDAIVDPGTVDTGDSIDSGALAAATGMLGATQFKPFMSGITYETPQIAQLIQTPKKDYVAALDDVIKRSLFEGIV